MNGLELQREKEGWESRLPEDRLSGLFVTAELKTGDRGREGAWRFFLFKDIGFLFKGSPNTRKDVFSLSPEIASSHADISVFIRPGLEIFVSRGLCST